MSEIEKKSKYSWESVVFIISIPFSIYANFFLVLNALDLTLGDKFFYFLTIMWYIYFPGIFAKYYGDPEKSVKPNKFLKFWKKAKSVYPFIISSAFVPIGLNEASYFITIVIAIIVIDITGLIYIFNFFDTEREKKGRIFRIVLLILFSGFSIIGQLFFPFTKVSPWRILLFELLWTALIADGIHQLLLKTMRGDEYKTLRKLLNLGATFFIVSLLFTYTAPLTVSNRTPIIAVKTGSMKPFINEGDLVFIFYFDPEDIQNNSVIAYYSENLFTASEPITVHRVINKWYASGQWFFKTCGDNNPEEDHYVVTEDIIYGVYWFKIPGVGKIFLDLEDMNFFPIFFTSTMIVFSITICIGIGVFLLRRRKQNHESVI